MRAVLKPVYYCDYCRRTCTLNPTRVCRWRIDGHSNGNAVIKVAPLAAELLSRATAWPTSTNPEADERTYLTEDDIAWVRGEVEGCPACMLAVLRQSGVDEFHLSHHDGTIFDYDAEVVRLRTEERESAEERTW